MGENACLGRAQDQDPGEFYHQLHNRDEHVLQESEGERYGEEETQMWTVYAVDVHNPLHVESSGDERTIGDRRVLVVIERPDGAEANLVLVDRILVVRGKHRMSRADE